MEKQTENNLDELIQQYIDEMTSMEKLVMEIARDHLES